MTRARSAVMCALMLVAPLAAAGQTAQVHPPSADERVLFVEALQASDFVAAGRLAASVLRQHAGSAAVLDEVTYQLAAAGAPGEAAVLLLQAYPFASQDGATREHLLRRLLHLLHGDAGVATHVTSQDMETLRQPLDTPQLRSHQAAFWALRGDCPAVAGILGDGSPEYAHDDLVRLGDCSRERAPAIALDAYARAHEVQPGGSGSRALAYLLHANGDYPRAVGTWRAIGSERLSPDELRAAVASAIAAGDAQQATRWLDALAARGGQEAHEPASVALFMDLGHLYWRENRLRAAQTAFERAWAMGRAPAAAEQLVYLHQRMHDSAAARLFARHTIDVRSADSRVGDVHAAPPVADRIFGFRRLHEDLGRRVTVNLDGWSGPRTGGGFNTSQPGRVFSSYAQMEIDYRLGRQPIRNGTTVSLFTRMLADGGAIGGAWPTDNATLGVGLRWKPFRRQVLYLAAEAQSGLENRDYRDVLVRASASLFNGGSHGDDWHPTGSGWFAQHLYLDAAHYVDADRTGLTADYRTSYHGKVAGSQSMEPYAHVQVNGLRTNNFEHDIRGGMGVRWNLWYGASRYDAPAHKLSLGVEFQQAFDTYLTDRRGVFFTLGSRW